MPWARYDANTVGRKFERDFFGRNFPHCYHQGITTDSLSFEQALQQVEKIYIDDYKHYRKNCPARKLLGLIRAQHHKPKVRLRCSIETVLDRDFGIDGYFFIRQSEVPDSPIWVATFDVTCDVAGRSKDTNEPDIVLYPKDLEPSRINDLAKAFVNILRARPARDTRGAMIN